MFTEETNSVTAKGNASTQQEGKSKWESGALRFKSKTTMK